MDAALLAHGDTGAPTGRRSRDDHDRSLNQPVLRVRVHVEPDGQSRGCQHLFRTAYGIAINLNDQPSRYRMIIAAPNAPAVTGTLGGQ